MYGMQIADNKFGMNAATFQAVTKAHESYCTYNQELTEDDAWLSKHGHPFAAEFTEINQDFDQLAYACNSNARFSHYHIEEGESVPSIVVQHWAPSLTLSWYPTGKCGKKFGRVYPALGNMWHRYRAYASRVKWDGAGANISYGQFIITGSQARRLASHLMAAVEHLEAALRPKFRDNTGIWVGITSIEGYRALKEGLRTYFEANPGMLPTRKEAGTFKKKRVLLKDAPVYLANSKEVEFKNGKVLVPLIPVGDSDRALAVCNGIMDIVSKGLPYSRVRHLLVGVLTKDSLENLDRRYNAVAA